MTRKDTIRLCAWIVSITALIGSLYFSEVKGFIPCEWCWYQRILMYPLVVILGVGFYRKDDNVSFYVLPLSVFGAVFAFFHYLQQKTAWFATAIQCSQGVPCSGEYINWLGFVTIPFMSLTAFTVITVLMSILRR